MKQKTQASDHVPFRGGGFLIDEGGRRGVSTLAIVLLIAAWQLASGLGLINPAFLPSPFKVLETLYDLALTGQLWADCSASLFRIIVGWSIGTALGLAFGVLMALSTIVRNVGKPLVAALFPIPKIAVLPLLILWLGVGELPKVTVIAFGVFFPTVISTYTSIDNVPRNLIRMAQSFGVPLRTIVRSILLPGALPGIVAGMRISTGYSLTIIVAAEMIAAEHGIGSFIMLAGTLFRSDQLIAGVVLLAIIGLTIDRILSVLENRWFRWR
ncbi:MAG: ABC transporter permease subunit [Rhodobacteraceae bacterium]|nr:ABC transporter permease subunit [Paracoccaceae bacterium]